MRKFGFVFPIPKFQYLFLLAGLGFWPCLANASPQQAPNPSNFKAPIKTKPPITEKIKKPTGKVIVTPLLTITGQAQTVRLPFKPLIILTPQMRVSGAPEPERLPFKPRTILTPKLEVTGQPTS